MIHQLHTGDYIDMSKLVSVSKPIIRIPRAKVIQVGFICSYVDEECLIKEKFFRDMIPSVEITDFSDLKYFLADGTIVDFTKKAMKLENLLFYQNELKNIEKLVEVWKKYKRQLI